MTTAIQIGRTLLVLQFFLIAFLIGISSGSTVLIDQAYGANNIERVRAVSETTITTALLLGAFVAVSGGFLTEPLLRLVGTPNDSFMPAVAYARITFVALPVLLVFLAYPTFLRGVGDSRTTFYPYTQHDGVTTTNNEVWVQHCRSHVKVKSEQSDPRKTSNFNCKSVTGEAGNRSAHG